MTAAFWICAAVLLVIVLGLVANFAALDFAASHEECECEC